MSHRLLSKAVALAFLFSIHASPAKTSDCESVGFREDDFIKIRVKHTLSPEMKDMEHLVLSLKNDDGSFLRAKLSVNPRPYKAAVESKAQIQRSYFKEGYGLSLTFLSNSMRKRSNGEI